MDSDQEQKIVTSVMPRIILVNSSRLVRELFHTVLRKAEHLQVVREIIDQVSLPADIESLEAEWLVMSLSSDEVIPAWVDPYLHSHPSIRFLAVSTDTSQVKMKWLESHKRDLEDLSLNDLIRILEDKSIREMVITG